MAVEVLPVVAGLVVVFMQQIAQNFYRCPALGGMTQLALRSDGNHSFVEHSEDLASVFNREFGDKIKK